MNSCIVRQTSSSLPAAFSSMFDLRLPQYTVSPLCGTTSKTEPSSTVDDRSRQPAASPRRSLITSRHQGSLSEDDQPMDLSVGRSRGFCFPSKTSPWQPVSDVIRSSTVAQISSNVIAAKEKTFAPEVDGFYSPIAFSTQACTNDGSRSCVDKNFVNVGGQERRRLSVGNSR